MEYRELLARIESQAVRIAELENANQWLKTQVDSIPAKIEDARKALIRSMANSSVNCGHYSSCALAMRMEGST